jgi:hypothetical protein
MLTGRFETMDPGKSESCCALRASQAGDIFNPATLHNMCMLPAIRSTRLILAGEAFLKRTCSALKSFFVHTLPYRTQLVLHGRTRILHSTRGLVGSGESRRHCRTDRGV